MSTGVSLQDSYVVFTKKENDRDSQDRAVADPGDAHSGQILSLLHTNVSRSHSVGP